MSGGLDVSIDQEQQAIVAEATAIAVAAIGPDAARVDREGAFPKGGIAALGKAGLLGLTVPVALRRPRSRELRTSAAVLDVIAQHCSSTAMVYLMHLCGVACYQAAPEKTRRRTSRRRRRQAPQHAGVERSGSRSHFWAPVSRAVGSNGHVHVSAREVVRHIGGTRRRLRRVHARWRGRHSRSRARCISFVRTMPA